MSEYCMKCMMPLDGKATCPSCGFAGKAIHAPHQLAPGTVLQNRYLLGAVIGEGGFGITYIGRDQTLGLRVAIKEYYPTGYANRNVGVSNDVVATKGRNEEVIRNGKTRFLGEARVLAQLYGTPGIVNVLNFFETNGTAYIVMEYLDGEDLHHRLKRGPLPADQVITLMVPIMDALQIVHERGIIHRDVSPDNIMLLQNGAMKLMDFGAARVVDYSDKRSMSVVLKAGFAPEEQYRARGEQGPWTDVYALCATIYKCITGVTPDDALQRLYEDELEWPPVLSEALTPEQEAALRKGLAPKAIDRFQSVAELKEALGLGADEKVPAGIVAAPPLIDTSEASISQQSSSSERIKTESEEAVSHISRVSREDAKTFTEPGTKTGKREYGGEDEPSPDEVRTGEPESDVKPGPKKKPGKGMIAALVAVVVAMIIVVPMLIIPPVYTVDFESGEGSEVLSVEATSGDQLEAPEEPTRKNYTFAGWYYDEALSQKAEFPLEVRSDLKLYAQWDEVLVKYTVKYVKDGTDEEVSDPKVVEGNSIGSKVTEKAPGIDGYKLVSDESQTLKIRASEKKNVITFKYKKIVGYTVNYVDQSSGTALAGQKVVTDALEGDEVTEEALSIGGYSLVSNSPETITLSGDSEANTITFSYTPIVVYEAPAQNTSSSKKSGSNSNNIEWAIGWD